MTPEAKGDEPEVHQDPKHVALRVFLDHPDVFDAASDMMALMARTSLAEFVGRDEGVEAIMDDRAKAEFETAAAAMFEQDIRSNYCRAGWYDDADELVLVIEHGSPITTTDVLQKDQKRVISFRAAEHAVLSYNSTTGLLKIGGVAKARRGDLAELFADKVLGKPEFFAGDDAQNLYTLDPVQRAGFGFAFNHDFDPGIQRVQITEVQVDRVGADPKTGDTRTNYSYVARGGRDNAPLRLGEMMRGARLGSDWRLNHIVIRVHFATGGKSAKKVTVKLKPLAHAMFKRQQFEGRIMTLLRRNGLLNDRDAAQYYKSCGIPFFAPGSSADDLLESPTYPIFQLFARDSGQIAAICDSLDPCQPSVAVGQSANAGASLLAMLQKARPCELSVYNDMYGIPVGDINGKPLILLGSKEFAIAALTALPPQEQPSIVYLSDDCLDSTAIRAIANKLKFPIFVAALKRLSEQPYILWYEAKNIEREAIRLLGRQPGPYFLTSWIAIYLTLLAMEQKSCSPSQLLHRLQQHDWSTPYGSLSFDNYGRANGFNWELRSVT
ncbi:MAG: hypothetical protein V6Z86_02550 [Hyphomicrobiales bacterium]